MAKLYLNMQRIHLYSSFIILAFLSLFFISGSVMVLPKAFPRKTVKTVIEKIQMNESMKNQSGSGIEDLCKKYNISGKLIVNETPGQKTYSFKRPGYRAEVIFKSNEDSVRIKIINSNLWSAMNDLHRLHGYEGDWINKTWALMYDLCCIALLVFAFTGLYLWWKLEKNKIPGLVFFSISSGLSLFTLWYIMAIG